jgi:hypothetical protein
VREPARRAQSDDLDRRGGKDRLEALVLVLVDREHADVRVLLCGDRVEEDRQLVRPPDRRDDEVERRKVPRHGS